MNRVAGKGVPPVRRAQTSTGEARWGVRWAGKEEKPTWAGLKKEKRRLAPEKKIEEEKQEKKKNGEGPRAFRKYS